MIIHTPRITPTSPPPSASSNGGSSLRSMCGHMGGSGPLLGAGATLPRWSPAPRIPAVEVTGGLIMDMGAYYYGFVMIHFVIPELDFPVSTCI